MPCNTIRLSTIDLSKVDQTLLRGALEALGLKLVEQGNSLVVIDRYGQRGTLKDGKLVHNIAMITSAGQKLTENGIKQAYSGQVVQQTARKFGWAVRETGENQYVMVRR